MNSFSKLSKIYFLFLWLFCLSVSALRAQEINAKVVVEHRQLQGTNVSVFETLENSLTEFINSRRWGNEDFSPNERIDCNFLINLTGNEGNRYNADITITARRPIYNASISTTILNLVDKDLSFSYDEYEQFIFNKNSLTQDLTAVIGFYVYMILGIDADTFREFGGDPYYNEAIAIVNAAQSATEMSTEGWDRLGSKRNRNVLISELLSVDFRPFRSYLYRYHRLGLDVMADDVEQGAKVILEGLSTLEEVVESAPASYAMLLFFDVKTQELQNIIREMEDKDAAAKANKKDLLTTLKKIDPSRTQSYDKLL